MTGFMTLNAPNAPYANDLLVANHAATVAAFNAPGSFVIGDDPAVDPRPSALGAATALLRYRSYAQFAADLSAGAITFGYRWVMYDNEDWAATPQNEMDDPWSFMPAFCQAARNAGYSPICAPARDLGDDPTSLNPRKTGETLEGWYIRTGIASAAAEGAAIVSIQTQADEATSEFATFYGQAASQAQATAPGLPVWAGVRSNQQGITAQQMMQDAQSVNAPGYWVNTTNPTAAIAAQFLALMA